MKTQPLKTLACALLTATTLASTTPASPTRPVGAGQDCDGNGIADDLEIAQDPSLDCDGSGFLDSCEIADFSILDRNHNGILDSCECIGTSYCTAGVNSNGTAAHLSVTGYISVSSNQLRLRVSGAQPNEFGMIYYGAGTQATPFGNGTLCVSSPRYRFDAVLQLNSVGDAAHQVDFDLYPVAFGPSEITPFSTWNFQFWYRDPGAGGARFNLSDALQITFCP